jgi:outer membrane protein
MKSLFICLFVCLIYSNSFAQNKPEEWNLEKCFDYAKRNNISLKRAVVQAKLAKLQYKQSKQNIIPTANFSTSLGDQSGRSLDPTTYTFTLQQLLAQNYQLSGSSVLYNFNKNNNQIKAQMLGYDAARLDAFKTYDDIKLKILQYYLQILQSKEQIHINEISIFQTGKQLEITQKQLEAGTNTELNVIQLNTKLTSDSLNLLSGKESYINNILLLKTLLNINNSTNFAIGEVNTDSIKNTYLLNTGPEIIYQAALRNLNQQKSDVLKIDAAKLNVKVAKANLYPSVSLSYNLTSAFSNYIQNVSFAKWFKDYGRQLSNNFNQQLSIGLSIPIFNNGKYNSSYEQAKLSLKDAGYVKEQDDAELRHTIFSLHNSAGIALERFNSSVKIAEGLQQVYDIYLTGYQAGGVNYLDLITNQNAAIKAKIDVINNKYDYFFKLKLLEFYLNGE